MSTYDDIAGFDTSSLGLGSTALQGGQAGIDVANAAFANLAGAARFANGVALIEAAAADGATSPVRALLAFADRLNQLDGDGSHFTAIGVEIAGLIASADLEAAAAVVDFLPAVDALQIGRGEAASVLVTMANSGALDVQLMAGCYLGQLVTRGSFEGGEGGAWPGGNLSMTTAVQAIHNAVVGGSLGETQAYGLLAGLMVSPFPAPAFQPMNELRALIGGDAGALSDVIDIFIASVGTIPFDVGYAAASNIMSLVTPFSTPDLSLPELAIHVHSAVAEETLTAEQAIAMMVRFASSYNADAIAAANDVATEVLSLVDDGFITQEAALDALTQGDAFTAARLLVAVAAADPDAAPAAGLHLATLIDTTTPTFMMGGNVMTAQQAVTSINTGVSLGGLSGTIAVVMLTAMAFVPGGVTSDRSAMNAAADGVRGLLAGTIGGSDAASAVVGALAPLGFTAEQGVTFLIALGASGFQQIFGSSVIWVNNADLAAAASAAIAGLIHDHGLSAASIGAALSAAFPLGLDGAELAVSTLVKAAPALAALEPDAYAIIGVALAQADAVSAGLAMGQVNDRVRGHDIDAEAGTAIVAAFAGAGTVEDQVAAGRALYAIAFWSGLVAAEAIAEIDAAVTAGVLTRGEAIVLLAGATLDGLDGTLAQIAAYIDVDPAAGTAALGLAVTAGALSGRQGLLVLAQVAALGSAATASAATTTLLSWLDDGAIAASDAATQLLGLADGGVAALQVFAGDTIGAMVAHGALDAATAIALVDAAVPGTLDASISILVLAHMSAAGDAALQSAVLDEINALIAGGDITLTNAVGTLQALLPGASAALQTVIDDALAILLTDPATLAQTAGLGSPAQVQAAVNAIVLLFSTDPTAAQGILDALAGRIDSGDLGSDQAATLLAKIYARGGDAADAALDTIVELTTSLDIPASTMANAIATQVAAGAIDAATAFVAFGALSPHGSPINAAVAGLISSGNITVAVLDAAVDAGQYSASNAIAVLGSVVPGAAPGLRAEALAEVQALVSEAPALASQALPIFMGLAVSGDHALRLVGREGIEALAAVAPGVGSAAFLQLLSYMPVPDTAFLADTQAALNGLLAGGYLTVAEAIQHIDDQLSPGNPSPLINAFQAVNILVALSAVDGARTAIYDYIRQEVAANSAAQAAGPSHPMWPFTAQPVIAALARGTVADLDHVEQTALVIVNISATLTTNQVVTSLGQGSTALIVVVAGFINRGMTEFGSYLAARVAALPPSEQIGSLDVISSLVGHTVDDLQLSDAVDLLLAVHAGGAKAAALAELADIGASVSFFIMGATTSGSTTLANGVEVMAALATSGAPGFDAAMANFIGDLLLGGQFTPAAVISVLEAAVAADALTAQDMVVLLQDVLVARLDPANLPASAALQSTILAAIDALIAANQVTFAEAVAAMASSASGLSGAMLFAIGGEIVAFVGGHAGSEAASVAAILAASTSAITGVEALGLLVGVGISGGAALQVAAGGGIAELVAAGSVTANDAAISIYNTFLNSGLALGHLVAVTAGLWANDGIGVGAEVLYQVGSHGLATYADLAGRLATVVDAGTLSAGEMIDGAVAVVLRASSTAAGADFIAALISHDVMAADDAVTELGASISPSGLSATDVVSIIAHVTADLPASAHLLGVGLAELAAAGQLSFADVGSGLSEALASPAVLSFTQAAALLIGAGTVAEVAAQAGAALIALIGSDAQRLADALDSIGDAIGAGTLTPAGGIALMVGIAEAGGQSQQLAVAEALDAMVQAGVAAYGDVAGSLTSEVTAGRMAGADALFVLLHLVHDATSAGQVVSFINYLLGQEALSAGDATGAVLAAVRDTVSVAPGNAADLLIELSGSHVLTPVDAVDRAVIVQTGAALANLVTGGEVTAASVLDQLAWPPFAVVPLLAAIEAAAGPQSSLGQGAQAALLTHVTGGFTYDVVQYVGQLVGPQGLTATQSLPILAGIAIHGGVEGQVAVGQVFARLLAEHTATTAELHAALYVDEVSNEAAAMMFAAMIDPVAGAIPVAVLELIVANVRTPQGAESWQPHIQPLIAALSSATLGEGPIYQATGLSLAQAVLAISAYARVGDLDVVHDVGVAIAALAQTYDAADSVFAMLGRALVSDPSYANLAGRQIAEVGVALGLTPEQTAEIVANGTAHGLTAADAVSVLARLANHDPVAFGHASGAAIAGLVNDQFTATQAMDALLGLSGIPSDMMVLLLAGFAGAGTAADQLAVGRAIADLPTFDVSLLSEIPANAIDMVVLGIASSDSPNAGPILRVIFLVSDDLQIPALTAALAAAVAAGTVLAADALQLLVRVSFQIANELDDDAALAMRTNLHEQLVSIVRDHLDVDDAIGILLTSVEATAYHADRMRAEVGGMLAALVDAGLVNTATVIDALTDALAAGTCTGVEVAALIAGAALNREYTNPFPDTYDFAVTFGHALGGLIEAGSITVGDALAGVLASQAAFRMSWPDGEVTMLAVVAGYDVAGLQVAVGHALAAYYQSGSILTSQLMEALDAMIGVPDGPSAQQALVVLFTMADDFEGGIVGLGGLNVIATEVGALLGRDALTAQEVADGITAEISAGHYSMGHGIAFLACVALANGAFTAAAAGEIGELIDGGLAPQDAIDALLAVGGGPAVARIIGTLVDQGVLTYGHAADAIVAAQGDGRLSMDDASRTLIALAETADEDGIAYLGHAFGDLIERGLDPVAVQTALFQSLQANVVSIPQASSLVAYVAGAITGLADADDYHYALGSVLAQATSEVGVGAVDRVYELGAIDAHDVVGLLTWMHGIAGTHTRWIIGQELWKMHDDGGVALDAIFEQIVATTSETAPWMQGALIGAIAATPTADASRQVAVGRALGEFIASGGMTFGTAMSGLNLASLSGDQYTMLVLSVAGGGGQAEELGVGQVLGGRLAAIAVGGDDVDLDTVALFDNAVAAGGLTVPELVVVLVGMGMVQYPSPYAARTSSYALDALVTSGRITVEDAMALIDGMAPSLDAAKLVHWLANAARLPALHDAVAMEIAELVSDGVLGATEALGYIREITGSTPQGTAALLAITRDTAAHLVIDIAGHGDTVLQDAAGAVLATLVINGSYLSDIAAAVTDGSLSPEGAVHVIANLVAVLASDPSATVRSWAVSQLDHYVDDGLVGAQTVSSVLMDATAHATTTGLISLGAILGTLGGGVAAIHDAIADGSLSAERGLDLLLSMGAVRDIGDPVFQAARDEIVALVQDGALTGTQVLAVTRAAGATGWLDESHVEVIAFSIFGDGSAADDAAVGAYAATRVDHLGDQFGVGDDTYFTGILAETGVAFLRVQNGQMTAAAAIAHIKEYAAEHDVSAYAGIFALEGLFGRYQNFSARQLAHDERIDMIALGNLAAELAGRVAEGTTSAYVQSAQGGYQFEAADPNALTRAEALQVLNWEAGLAFTQDQVALARYMFANDLWVAEQVRLDSSPTSPITMTNVVNGMLPGNPYLNTFPDVGRSGYAYDLALVSLLERVTAPDRVPDYQDYTIALEALSTRLTQGIAQDALISQYVEGNLTFAQVLEALDTLVAATGLGSTPAHQQLMHSMSLAWLNLRAREYIAEHPGTGGAIEAAQFMQQLRDPQYGDELLTGYGALLAMTSSGAGALVTSLDKQAAYDEAFSLIRSRTPATLSLSDRDQAVLDALIPMADGMQWALDKVPIGRAFLTVGEDPTDAAAYARLGAHVGTIFANKLAVDALFAHTPWGAAITAAKFGAQVGLFVLGMGAVQDALGEGPTLYLRGQLTMAGATASLLGDTISDIGQAGAEIIIQSAPHFIAFSDAVNRGDAEGIASSIGEIAMDYYKLQTGVDLRLYGAVGERFADLMVHLFTGDTGALGDDVRALGAAYLDTIIQNPYLAAIGERMVQYAETINRALTDINDSYRILGHNVATGLLLVGTHLDDAGTAAIRAVAHTVGGVIDDILSGLGIDGYISGATVFADANFNGVLDAGEASATTDANGRYSIAANGAPLILQGGFDIATNLAFSGTMMAPAGSTAITPLTTLIQQVAASTTGDPVAAQQLVALALGLNASLDLNDFDPIAGTRTGVAGAADAFATAASVLNTVSLLRAAGATDAYEALAARIVAVQTLDLTDTATIVAVAASAGVAAGLTGTVAQLATASNALAAQAAASGGDPMRFMRYVTAVSIAAQGDTAHDLAAAGSDATQLANVIAEHTGANLTSQVNENRTRVGDFGGNGSGGGEVPLQISADGLGIELALSGGNSVAGNWVRLAAQDTGLQAGSTVVVYAIDEFGNIVDRAGIGGDPTEPYTSLGSVSGVEDDHGGRLLLGSQSVYLAAGEQLRFAVLGGNQDFDTAPAIQLAARGDGSLLASVGGQQLNVVTNNSMTAALALAEAQRDTGDAFVFLRQGETLNVELAGSSSNVNTLGFVRMDIDATSGARSVAGVAYDNTAAFAEAVRDHMDAGFRQVHGGDFATMASWTVAGATGYYAPVLITPRGEIFVVGTANSDRYEHIRVYGENTFGFEDLAANQGSDFDYNDMVMRLHSMRGDFS